MALRTWRRGRKIPAQEPTRAGRRRTDLYLRIGLVGSMACACRLLRVPAIRVDDGRRARRTGRRHGRGASTRVRLWRVRRLLLVRVVPSMGASVVLIIVLGRITRERRAVCAMVRRRSRGRRPEARVTRQITTALLLLLLLLRPIRLSRGVTNCSAARETRSVQEIHLVSTARGVVAAIRADTSTRTRSIVVRVRHGVRGRTGEGVVRRGLTPSAVEAHRTDTGRTTGSSRAVVEGGELSHVVALRGVHGRLDKGAVRSVGVTGGQRAKVTTAVPALAETIIRIEVVVGEGRRVCGLGSGLRDLAVELLGAATADGVGEESDDDDEDCKADDSEYARYGTSVLEEATKRVRSREMGA
ncbi:hypothetical protein BV20DRAFT_778672 [Pilatotrama ljubarskyi]|nr:hypothetical protein BV20DRAFT_778672 [Pilatotrama ljubarskyi]